MSRFSSDVLQVNAVADLARRPTQAGRGVLLLPPVLAFLSGNVFYGLAAAALAPGASYLQPVLHAAGIPGTMPISRGWAIFSSLATPPPAPSAPLIGAAPPAGSPCTRWGCEAFTSLAFRGRLRAGCLVSYARSDRSC